MELYLKLLALIAGPIALLTALINFGSAVAKTKGTAAISSATVAVVAIVLVCLIVVLAICYVSKK